MPALVEMAGLTRDYGWFRPRRALDSLDLSVGPGEVVGLLGPNGSGKSTALRLLLGFMRPTRGTVRLAGLDPWNEGPRARLSVAYLPGELRLYENLSALELARFLGELRGGFSGDRARRLARSFDLDLDTPLAACSSGMKRKAALVAILALNAPLLVLDEPTNTLDPAMRERLLEEIARARSEGKAVLFSSHVLEEVEKVCDRVAVLRKGRLAATCDGEAMRRGRRVVARKVAPLAGPPGVPGIEDSSSATHLILEVAEMTPALLRWLADQPLEDLRIEPATVARLYRSIHPESADPMA